MEITKEHAARIAVWTLRDTLRSQREGLSIPNDYLDYLIQYSNDTLRYLDNEVKSDSMNQYFNPQNSCGNCGCVDVEEQAS